METLEDLRGEVTRFVQEREWGQFHTPKNIAMALTVEVAELVEHFQWLTPEASGDLSGARLGEVADEIADVQIYLVQLADRLGIDLLDACACKMEKNRKKYPVEQTRARSVKDTKLESRE